MHELPVLDLVADSYMRVYCHDAVLQRGLPGDLLNTNIWYTIDNLFFAILVTLPWNQKGRIDLTSVRELVDVLRWDVRREALFSASVVRHFLRQF